MRAAKITIAKEEEEFKTLKERHASRYGSRGDSHQRQDKPRKGDDDKTAQQEELVRDEATPAGGHAEVEQKSAAHQDAHDESGDVLVDADEDMVIY